MKYLLALSLTALAVSTRLLPHPPDLTPMIAVALFAGTYLEMRFAILVVLVALIASDMCLGLYNPASMAFVYGATLFIATLGFMLRKRVTLKRVAGYSFAGAVIFFIVTNFGVWAVGSLYPHDPAGFAECYLMALPFFGDTLLGTAAGSLGLFGLYGGISRLVFGTESEMETA